MSMTFLNLYYNRLTQHSVMHSENTQYYSVLTIFFYDKLERYHLPNAGWPLKNVFGKDLFDISCN